METAPTTHKTANGFSRPRNNLFMLWPRLAREYSTRIRKCGLPINLATTLLRLHLHPNISEPAVLAELDGRPRQTMTWILDALEKRGLAARSPHLNDRRRKIIRLLPKGHQLAKAICRELTDFETSALRALGDTERHAFRQMITRYTDILAAKNAVIAQK